MAENLRTTRYADGTAIPYIQDDYDWGGLGPTDKAYCWYDNTTQNGDTYGGIYTWAAAMNGFTSSNINPCTNTLTVNFPTKTTKTKYTIMKPASIKNSYIAITL